jgi:hypothetical protein
MAISYLNYYNIKKIKLIIYTIMEQTIIEYKGRQYQFTKSMYLTDKMFYDRCWFIVKNYMEENIDSLADMYISWKFFKVEYTKDFMEKLRKLESNMTL